MNKLLGTFAVAAAAFAAPSYAFTVNTLADNGNEVDTSFSGATMLSVDYDFNRAGDIVLQIDVDAGADVPRGRRRG